MDPTEMSKKILKEVVHGVRRRGRLKLQLEPLTNPKLENLLSVGNGGHDPRTGCRDSSSRLYAYVLV